MDTGLVPNQLGPVLDWLKGHFKPTPKIPLDPTRGEKFNDQPTVMANKRQLSKAPLSEQNLKGLINPSTNFLNQGAPFYSGHMPQYTPNDLLMLEALRKPQQGI